MLTKQPIIFTVVALVSAPLALLAAIEPKFGQAGGASPALAIVSAGFAIAAAISRGR